VKKLERVSKMKLTYVIASRRSLAAKQSPQQSGRANGVGDCFVGKITLLAKTAKVFLK
jgi:hypothetical protein